MVRTRSCSVRTDIGERVDLASRRQDIARKLRPLLNDWERDVDAEAKSQSPKGPSGASGVFAVPEDSQTSRGLNR